MRKTGVRRAFLANGSDGIAGTEGPVKYWAFFQNLSPYGSKRAELAWSRALEINVRRTIFAVCRGGRRRLETVRRMPDFLKRAARARRGCLAIYETTGNGGAKWFRSGGW